MQMESAVSAPVSGHIKRVVVLEGRVKIRASLPQFTDRFYLRCRRLSFARRPSCRDRALDDPKFLVTFQFDSVSVVAYM